MKGVTGKERWGGVIGGKKCNECNKILCKGDWELLKRVTESQNFFLGPCFGMGTKMVMNVF